MSGTMRRVRGPDGREYDVPEENADAFLAEMGGATSPSGGNSADPEGVGDSPSPTAPGSSDATLGPPRREGEGSETEEGSSAWGHFADAAVKAATAAVPGLDYAVGAVKDPVGSAKTAYDAVGGALHGASSGLGDDVLDALPGNMGDETRAQWAQSQARSPGAYAAGDMAGSFLSPINKIAKGVGLVADAPGALGFAKNVAGQALEGGIDGAARSFGDADESANTGESALRALAEGGEDALKGGAMTGLLSGAGRVSDAAAQYLGGRADMNRAASAGFYGGKLNRLGQNKGDEYVGELGQRMEEQGLHQGRSPGGNWNPLNWLPQNAGTIAENAKELKGRAVTDMAIPEREIERMDSPPMVDVNQTIDRQRQPVPGSEFAPAGNTENAFRGGMADRFQGVADEQGQIPFPQALAGRRYLDKQIDHTQLGGYADAPMQQQVYREMAGDLRQGTGQALDQSVAAGELDPQLAQQWNTGRQNYETGADVYDAARDRAMREQGNQAISLPASLAVGGAIGGASAALGGDPRSSAETGVGTAIAMQMMKTRGRAGMAGMQRAGSNALGAASNLGKFGELGGVGNLTAQQSAGHDDDGEAALSALGAEMSKTQQEARGYLLPQAVKQLMATDPSALGQYAQQFQQAGDDDRAISDLLDKLGRDQQFSRSILPRLNQMTAEQ